MCSVWATDTLQSCKLARAFWQESDLLILVDLYYKLTYILIYMQQLQINIVLCLDMRLGLSSVSSNTALSRTHSTTNPSILFQIFRLSLYIFCNIILTQHAWKIQYYNTFREKLFMELYISHCLKIVMPLTQMTYNWISINIIMYKINATST